MSRRAPRPRNVPWIARAAACAVAVLALVIGTVVPIGAASASASVASPPVSSATGGVATADAFADLSGFSAGNIISDEVFTDDGTMTEAQIQAFFDGKVKTCRTGKDEDGKPFVCLKDYRITSVDRPADKYCDGYKGAANESAARIIYRAAQSCGINPQVLIVMLQKEQSLVTHTWPSAWRYDKALGQGCPDGGVPCNAAYVGFFHQIYGAARQMQIYMEGKYFTWYAPGKTWNLLFHPNRSCGTSPVKIVNKATSALYYYTPYQPNAAALKAGYGTGDSCSSYGNRNFYNYFTDWFGPTSFTVTGAIQTEWERLGSGSGQLGNPTTNAAWVASNGGGYVQQFDKGTIWLQNKATRAFAMGAGPFLEGYRTAGAERGSWGWPMSEATCGMTDGGCRMDFQKGGTYYSKSTGSVLVPTVTLAEYRKIGAEKSPLGYPKSASKTYDGVVEQAFAAGTGIYTKANGLVPVSPAILAVWKDFGGSKSSLGLPKAAAAAVAANGAGKVQEFTSGTIWESGAGAFAMGYGPFRDAYAKAGGASGSWGWPTSAASCGLPQRGCMMSFQNGLVGYSPSTGSVLMSAAAGKEWLRLGITAVGYPKTVQQKVAANGGGTVQEFTAGTMYTSAHGAFGMGFGPFRTNYIKDGGPSGAAGWPAGAAKCRLTGGGCLMPFQNGTVGYSPKTGSVLMSAAVTEEWLRVDPRSVGYPKTAPTAVSANGGGSVQEFTAGTVFSTKTGSHAMGFGPFRTNYLKAGGPSGSWGWPTSGATCGLPAGGCTMTFQKGVVAYSGATGSQLVPAGALLDEWNRRGGASGSLGYPTAAAKTSGSVTTQNFQKGTISFDSASGSVTVR